ncbi:MAG: pyridoxal-phosphate dependent enzyme [Acidobacteriota bacterium]|nr:pyridoxal-phosphate dependent enzyme [Acidobacteriota bacterium]
MATISAIEILAARRRIARDVRRTPLVRSDWLSEAAGVAVYLKLECLQVTGAFKVRGAFNAARALAERSGGAKPTLVTASAGNHGRALALAARALGLPLVVFAPRTAPRAKLDPIESHGADLRLEADYDEAERQAKALAARGDATFVSPYSDADVIAGAGTVAVEIFEDQPDVGTIVVPLGGGGLLSGTAIASRAISPDAAVIGVEVEASHPFHDSLKAGRLVEVQIGPTLADGLAGNADPDTITFDYIQRLVSGLVMVGESELRSAMRGLAGREHLIAEAAGAVGVAAVASGQVAPAGRSIAVIVSGGNIDLDKLQAVLTDR